MFLFQLRAVGVLAYASAVAMLAIGYPACAQATVIVTSTDPYQLGAGEPGSQSGPAVAPNGGNGTIATWLSPGGGAKQHAYVGYFSLFGDQHGAPQIVGSASGPSTGSNALSAAPVDFDDTTAMVFFAADPRNGASSTKQDVFAQRLSSFGDKDGLPFRVNQTLTGTQTAILAAHLSNDNALAIWLSHGTAASSFNLRGRVIRPDGTAAAAEKPVTQDSAGAQTATGLTALTDGNAVLAYFVRSGNGATAQQTAFLQRLDSKGARLGKPAKIKQTVGPNTYGGVAVTALPQGGYMALWWVAGASGHAVLKRQVFSAGGTGGAIATVGTGIVKPASQSAPKVAFSQKDGVMVILDQFSAGSYSITAVLLNKSGKVIADPHQIASGKSPLVSTSLAYEPLSQGYAVSWTQTSTSSHAVRSFARPFYVSAGCTSKC